MKGPLLMYGALLPMALEHNMRPGSREVGGEVVIETNCFLVPLLMLISCRPPRLMDEESNVYPILR